MIDERSEPEARQDARLADFERFYRQHVDRVHSFARARLDDATAEDVVSEVFHAAALAVRDGNDDVLTIAWLMTVTRNRVIDRWRKAARWKTRTQLFAVMTREDSIVQDEWTDRTNRSDVVLALDRLGTRDRSLLVLHYVDGMPAPEIAEALGLSVSAIESALARARRKFRRVYSKGGGQ